MLQLLELLMLKASSYTWKSVRSFYAHTQNRSSCVAWNSTMPHRFAMQPQFSSKTLIYGIHCLRHALTFRLGADPLLVIPTLVLRSLTPFRLRCAVSGTILVLARVIQWRRPIQGITNVEFAPKTILCYIVLSDKLPSLKITSILRSHRDSRAPTRLRTTYLPH